MKFLKAFTKRGIAVRIDRRGQLVFRPVSKIDEKMAAVIDANRDEIISEIQTQVMEDAKTVRKMLSSLGYAYVWSEVLRDRIIIIADESKRASVSGHLLPIYSLAECRQLFDVDEQQLRLTHEVKKSLGGRVEPVYPENVADPRPDIRDDHELWERLLVKAKQTDFTVYGLLCGFRSWGAMLSRSLIGWSITFDVHQSEGWSDRSAFNADYQEYLQPYVKQLRSLLKSLESQEVAA